MSNEEVGTTRFYHEAAAKRDGLLTVDFRALVSKITA
jgi:hypothetical protein